jgi:HAD superfamily hydrolase (TIGR01509 family)
MDGLLLDTERISLKTFVEACQENGFEPDVNIYFRCIGTNEVRTKEILTDGYGTAFPYDAVTIRWRQKFNKEAYEKGAPLKSGVKELLSFLEQNQVRMAVVTSSRRDVAVKGLGNAGLLKYFEFVIGGDQISNGKPHPEIYQKACSDLGLPPKDCLALEDSDNGVRSAGGAGLQVIQVKDLLEPSAEVRALGYPLVNSLLDVQKYLKDQRF